MKTFPFRKHACFFSCVLGFLINISPGSRAHAEISKSESEFFEAKVRPLLADNCYKCHSSSAAKLKGGLSVESKEALLTGGDGGPALVPGNPDKSLIITAVRYADPDLQMPPKGKKLSPEQIATLEQWVKMGAPDPRSGTTIASKKIDPGSHWSFQPLKKIAVPTVVHASWCATPIDNFIVAKLEEKKIEPAAIADKRTLLRRATFDLTGLPPSQQEVDDFMFDESTNSFEKVVDRLLASPQYGERWGRFWLDVARYSDTKGEVKRQQESSLNPFAWTYRDYVIGAFNDDKPFNQFIVEQIAADKIQNGDRKNLAALGFLTVGEHFGGMANDILNDRIDVVTKGFLGLTVTCARCHDHKFDPIPTADYYSLRGIFNSCGEPKELPTLAPIKMNDDYDKFLKEFTPLQNELAELRLKLPRTMTPEERKQWIRRQGELMQRMALMQLTNTAAPARAMTLTDTRGIDSPIFIRGEAGNKGATVPRRFLECLSGPTRQNFTNGSGRIELARAIASPANPITARCLVNRVWLHHFGEGFVPTPDDLGMAAESPSHPELLDYLARRFMSEGWSVKKLHKLIMLSSVYQESSTDNEKYAALDPHNRLLWRANIRRLEFEAVRDSILAIGGSLDSKMSGRPVQLGRLPYSMRRSVYGFIDRQNLPDIFTQFDFANPDAPTGKRYETLVPQQALFLMNSPIVVEQARKLVERAEFDKLADDEKRVRYLYNHIYQREPTVTELKIGLAFIDASPAPEALQASAVNPILQQRQKGQNKPGQQLARLSANAFTQVPLSGRRPLEAWDKYAHALMQANEAMFVN
ncbi:MAG: hypothetical protein RLZZ350_1433 [Verrucomicrobiota bacterium]|jgi:hypothetical protein